MSSKPLVYENVAIGVIAQRVGECRLANRYISNPQQLVTQQITSLEKLYRDSVIAEGDKFIVIEFKAPRLSSKGLKYESIDVRALMAIANKFREENVFLALIHAYLPPNTIPKNVGNGFYLWFAVPGTTAFIPLSNLPQALKASSAKISLAVINAHPSMNIAYISTQIPSCVRQPTPIVKQEPYCASCGGLFFGGPGKLRIPELRVDLNGNTFNVKSYTFASLMKSFTNCLIGFRIGSTREVEELHKLLQELYELTTSLALLVLYKEGISFIPISSSRIL
jgi:hypothetical protein